VGSRFCIIVLMGIDLDISLWSIEPLLRLRNHSRKGRDVAGKWRICMLLCPSLYLLITRQSIAVVKLQFVLL